MSDPLLASLRHHFGFPAFRPGQRDALDHVLAGRHALVVMPTGAGKSLIYQLAALHLPGVTLVISPLVALMKDQVDSLTRRDLPATYINSLLSTHEQSQRLEALARGAYRLVYIAPERLRHLAFLNALSQVKVSLLAVDEAHCISEWGHDFRPDYLRLAEARTQMGHPVTVALTATATPRVQQDILHRIGLTNAERIVTGFNRLNLTFEVRSTPDVPAKLKAIQHLLAEVADGAAIIYVGTRHEAEEVAEFARIVIGRQAEAYHAGLDVATRNRVQSQFIAGDLNVIVATNAFGMGIDRPDVRLVAHFALPGTLEAYYQEAGRAGRDGEPARAILLYAPQDRALQEWFIEEAAPGVNDVQSLYRALQAQGRGDFWMTAEDLSLITGLPEVKVRLSLAHLERVGAVIRLGDDGPGMLLRVGQWDEAAGATLQSELHDRQRVRRTSLDHMIAYAESNDCRRQIILTHFGDMAPATATHCCDNCLARQPSLAATVNPSTENLTPAERAALAILDAVRRLRWDVGREKLALLLKGSKARAMQTVGYTEHLYYGRLASFALGEIEGMIAQLINQGYLKAIGGDRPTLKLTPLGEQAIKSKTRIALDLPRGYTPKAAEPKKAKREAGTTVELTYQMLNQGLTPAQIAAERGLAESTIYGHLADLIQQGRVEVTQVLSADAIAQVHAAIAQVGDTSRLTPLKEILPDDISYHAIRWAIAEWERIEQAVLDCAQDLAGQLPRSSMAKLLVGSPSQRIAAWQSHPLYNRLRGYSRDEILMHVDRLIASGKLTKNEQGKVTLGAVPFSNQARGRSQTSPEHSSTIQLSSATDDPIAAFLATPHARPLSGPWHTGWALDFHSRFAGADWSRSGMGGLAYQLKYAGDKAALHPLVDHILTLCEQHPDLREVDAIVPVPPSTARDFNPVGALAAALSQRLNLPTWPALVKTRATAPQKVLRTLAQKQANVAGAFAARGPVRGRRLLVVDDLYDSGATLEEVTRVLTQAGAARVCVLTLTRTIHADS